MSNGCHVGGSGSLVKGIGDHSRGTGIQDGRSGNQMCDPGVKLVALRAKVGDSKAGFRAREARWRLGEPSYGLWKPNKWDSVSLIKAQFSK